MKGCVLFFLLTLCFPLTTQGMWARVPTEDLVRDSNLIVVGTLQQVSEYSDGEIDYRQGVIVVHEVLWGDARAGERLTLKWQNLSGLVCPRVEHDGNENVKGVWLLTLDTGDNSVRADYPGRFVELEKQTEVESWLESGLFIDGGSFQVDEPFIITVIFRNASESEKRFAGLSFSNGLLFLSPQSKLITSRYMDDGDLQPLRPKANSILFLQDGNSIVVPPSGEVKATFDLKSLYNFSARREGGFSVELNLAGLRAANEATVTVSLDEELIPQPTLKIKSQPGRQTKRQIYDFQLRSPRDYFSPAAVARATAVFLLALMFFRKFYRD